MEMGGRRPVDRGAEMRSVGVKAFELLTQPRIRRHPLNPWVGPTRRCVVPQVLARQHDRLLLRPSQLQSWPRRR